MRLVFLSRLTVTAALLFAGVAYGADPPKWTRLSISANPTVTATISWNTVGNVPGEVQYGLGQQYGNTTPAPQATSTPIGWVHTAVVAGLTPSTVYHYRVGNGADGYSADFTLATAPASQCEVISFVAGGDGRHINQGAASEWTQVLDAIAAQTPDFVVGTGDAVYDGSDASQWQDYFTKSAMHLPRLPIMNAIGNHDDGPGEGKGANFNQQFAYPANSVTNTEDFYSFDYGPVHVVALSTETFNQPDLAMQAAWLDADLAGTDRLWKVVYFHRPPYSSGNHGSNEGGKIVPALTDVFDKHHVDVVLSGHDHDYERFKPTKGGKEVVSYGDGTLYIVTGGAGSLTDPLFLFRNKLATTATRDNALHYVLFTVNRGTLTLKAERVPAGLQGGMGTIEQLILTKQVPLNLCAPAPADGGGGDLFDAAGPVDAAPVDGPRDAAVDAAAPAPVDAAVGMSGDASTVGGTGTPTGCGCALGVVKRGAARPLWAATALLFGMLLMIRRSRSRRRP